MTKENTQVDGEFVQVPKKDWDGLLADMAALKNKRAPQKFKRITERTATIRFHEGKPVVWMGNVRDIKDPTNGKLVGFFDIKTFGSDKAETVNYLEFLNATNYFQVKILSQKAQEVEQSGGEFIPENPDPAKIASKSWSSGQVESVVRSYVYTAEVEVVDGPDAGKTFTVPSTALNQ